MIRALCLALLFASAAPTLARAQADEPIPYPDDPNDDSTPRRRNLPPRSDPTVVPREETDVEKQDREVSLAGLDDPHLGWAVEALGGVMLLDSARAQLAEPAAATGARVTWEVGRLFFDQMIRDGLAIDLDYRYAYFRSGTTQIFEDANYHYFTVAPSFGFTLGGNSDYLVYGQAGGGMVLQYASLHFTADKEAPLMGVKPALLYGIGLRGRPLVSHDGLLRFSFRAELTRFRRGYMDDTYLGASVGAAW